jgi:uncharacterized damage-inducible protein DinB
MTTTREFFKQRWEAELPMFSAVLHALPTVQLDYKPHERSNSAGTIAWMMTEELKSMCDAVENGTAEWAPRPQPKTTDEIANEFDSLGKDLSRKLAATDEARWASKSAFMAGGKEVFSSTRGEMVWWILFDLIHHRGQLTAYIRPMGGKVPAVYGPSADTQ